MILRFGHYGLDFDLSNKKSAKWNIYQLNTVSENNHHDLDLSTRREIYLSEIRNSIQIKILGFTLYARPKLILGKIDIDSAYIGENNRSTKLYSIIDLHSLSEIHGTCLVHSKIRLGFLIAFVMDDNCMKWVEALQKFDFDLWFTVLTAKKDEVFFLKAKPLSHYLNPINVQWEDNISKKVQLLVSTFPDLLVFAKDQFGNRAIDVAQLHFKAQMEKQILFRDRYLIDVLSHALIKPIYRSNRSIIVSAIDYGSFDCYGCPIKCAIKFFSNSLDYLCEVVTRKRWNLSKDFVVPILDSYFPQNETTFETIYRNFELPKMSNISDCDGKPFIVMPLAENDLKTVLSTSSATDQKLAYLLTGLWRCIDHFHSKGVIFGNLDPSNVVIIENQFKLIDMDMVTPIGHEYSFFMEQNFQGKLISNTGSISSFCRKFPCFIPSNSIVIQSQKNSIKFCSDEKYSTEKYCSKLWYRWLSESDSITTNDAKVRSDSIVEALSTATSADISDSGCTVATVSFDMWQLGCILYFCLFGCSIMDFSTANTRDASQGLPPYEIRNLFELGVWNVDSSCRLQDMMSSCDKLSHIRRVCLLFVMELLSQDPSARLKYNLKQVEEKINEDESSSLSAFSHHYNINISVTTSPDSFEVSNRRTYYMTEFQSNALENQLSEILNILGRNTTEDSVILTSLTPSDKESETKTKIRVLKQVISSEQLDYPTSIRLRLPNAPGSLSRKVNDFMKVVFPILWHPTAVNSLYHPKPRIDESLSAASSLNASYVLLDLVCEICFEACPSKLWPLRISLLPQDKIFLNKISPIANATLRAANEVFRSKIETSAGPCEIFDGRYTEGILEFIGIEGYRSVAADTRACELENLLSAETKSLRSLLHQASSLSIPEKKSDDYKSKLAEERRIIDIIQKMITGLEPQIMKEAVLRTRTSFKSGDAIYDILTAPKIDGFNVMDCRVEDEFEGSAETRGVYCERLGTRKGKGFSAREFRLFLATNDPDKDWGGLKRIILPSGLPIWVCSGCFIRILSDQGQLKAKGRDQSDRKKSGPLPL